MFGSFLPSALGWFGSHQSLLGCRSRHCHGINFTQHMNTVVISATREISLDDVRALLARHWSLLKTPPDRLAIEESNSRVYLYHPRLDSGATDPKQLFLDYSSQELVKSVILAIGDHADYVINNEYGTALPGDEFVARLRNGKTWEWAVGSKPGVPRPLQQVIVQTVHFLGEQDGTPEQELKDKLVILFGQLRLVNVAYLAVVRYGNAVSPNVALCVRGQPGQNRMFAERVSRVFGPIFGSHEHLDVIWLTPEQETNLAKVCRPFYGAK